MIFAQVGDVITCTSRPDGGWWRGILRGREGVFPDNFVKVGIMKQKSIDHSMQWKYNKEGLKVIMYSWDINCSQAVQAWSFRRINDDDTSLKRAHASWMC